MSGTLDAMILEKAVALWRDPAKRLRGNTKMDGRMCAMDVLMEAQSQIGVYRFDLDQLAGLVGIPFVRIIHINDHTPFGQRYLYWRMKRALKKARA